MQNLNLNAHPYPARTRKNTRKPADATIELCATGRLDESAPVYVVLTQNGVARSCLMSYREARALLMTGQLPTLKPYMDRQLLLEIGRLLRDQTTAVSPTAALA